MDPERTLRGNPVGKELESDGAQELAIATEPKKSVQEGDPTWQLWS